MSAVACTRCVLKGFIKKDFDAWAYNLHCPRSKHSISFCTSVNLVVEDIKFAYNAWCLLRLALFYGVSPPTILSTLTQTTPSMDIAFGGNRLFYMHAKVGGQLSAGKTKIALTPCNSRAVPIQSFNWRNYLPNNTSCGEHTKGVELVLGMENGLSQRIIDQCDHCIYIPQYGSIGSLSMISALGIATHTACVASYSYASHGYHSEWLGLTAIGGHMPQSNHPTGVENQLPHETDLLRLSNPQICDLLRFRRETYALQIGLVIYNEHGDRNIGAVMRNMNAFNCSKIIILNRKRFNRRGAVGTQRLLETLFCVSVSDFACQRAMDGYVVWLLYPYYPYLRVYSSLEETNQCEENNTFLRPDDAQLVNWLRTKHLLTEDHPLTTMAAHLVNTEVYLDDIASLKDAIGDVVRAGFKGILLAVPEEGSSPHKQLTSISSRVLYVTHPDRLPHILQRGLNPALSTAIALERMRSVIDSFTTR